MIGHVLIVNYERFIFKKIVIPNGFYKFLKMISKTQVNYLLSIWE